MIPVRERILLARCVSRTLAARFGEPLALVSYRPLGNQNTDLYFRGSVFNVESRDVHECGERQSTDGKDHDGPYQQRRQRAVQTAIIEQAHERLICPGFVVSQKRGLSIV